MTAARIILTQEDVSGAPGISRRDLVLGQPVTLTNQDDVGVRSWRWSMVARPDGSAATISGSVQATASFTPDIAGSYLVELHVDQARDGQRNRVIGAVLETFGDTEIRWPAAGETTEANWFIDGTQNSGGWTADVITAIRAALLQPGAILDTRGASLAIASTAGAGGTQNFTLVLGSEKGLQVFLRLTGTSTDTDLRFYRDAARTDEIYAVVGVDPSAQFADRTPATLLGDDGSTLESDTIYGTVTNNSGSASTYGLEVLIQGIP